MTMPQSIETDVQRFAEMMGQQFQEAVQRAAGGQEMRGGGEQGGRWQGGGGMQTMAPPMAGPEVQERIFPLLATLLPIMVSAVPQILQVLQEKNRDIIQPSRDPEQIQRNFMAVLGVITPQIVGCLPELIQRFQMQPELQESGPEADRQRFAALMSVLAPRLIFAMPQLVMTLAEGRRDLAQRVHEPEVAGRFIGPMLMALAPALARCAPQLHQAWSGRQQQQYR